MRAEQAARFGQIAIDRTRGEGERTRYLLVGISAPSKNHAVAGTRVQSRRGWHNGQLSAHQPARGLEREDADHLRGTEVDMRALGAANAREGAGPHASSEPDVGH